ncbi:MAG TPA: RsmD family RNA methyltransferase [Candidatus Coprenecus stercoravium]|uniref:RsmD family RNA methyltransferase n=1 Tax=Candidatus Coprenecus stercoravium TaxID=2840735 RepID=A0A9D2GRQ2_9BACT|nr:RsmD family RNA methyltransferase [Candidatus Coprenecus stercoravium]
MRIIGGSLKGRTVMPPSGFKARPTTDFAKEGLFNILNNEYDLSSVRVLDLFSGTGSISFEFASRGAGEIYSVEMNPLHAAFIKKTAASFNIKGMRVVRHNVFEFLDICRLDFDIIFADPPYSIDGLDTIPDRVFAAQGCSDGILKEGGTFILEHPGTYSFKEHPRFDKERKYGNVHFSFFK